MGNTITKESGANPGPNRAVGSSNGFSGGYANKPRSSHSHHDHATEPSSRRSGRSHRSHGRSSRHKREGYEMIIDPNETVDGGYLFPQGVYQGAQDYKVANVRDVIIKRKMAPFYKGLDHLDAKWTDEELLENVKGIQPKSPPKNGQPGPPTDTQQIWLYRNVHECPICFLMYPRLNETRCCGQDICTECFVQIKRNPPHPPYTSNADTEATDVLELLSEPTACPYCAQPNLGIVFDAPPFEWGIPSTASSAHADEQASPGDSPKPTTERKSPSSSTPSSNANSVISIQENQTAGAPSTATPQPRPRRASLPATHSSVVTVDMIRPDWEEKLASARRRLARKSAAARALHQAALLPNQNDDGGRGGSPAAHLSSSSSTSSRNRRIVSHDPAMASLVQATRSMSIEQTRALEQKMLDEAIRASLAQR